MTQPASPTNVPALLATACDTLDHIAAVLYEHAGRAGHLIAPFMVAAAAAADGRDAVLTAPSLPPEDHPAPPPPAMTGTTPAAIATSIATTAQALSTQLAAVAVTPFDPRDRQALAIAARSATTIRTCLAGTG